MNTDKKDNMVMYAVAAFVVGAVIFGVIHFITNDDGGATGGAILGQQGGGFWAAAIIFSILAVIAIVLAVFRYRKTQDGNSIIPFLIVAAIFFGAAFGKGCTDKASGGVTTEKGRPAR